MEGNEDETMPEADPPLVGEEVIPEALRLHSTIPTQTATKSSRYQKFQPKNAVSRTGVISFEILTGDKKYLDPNSIVLHVECSIRDSRWDAIPRMTAGPPPVFAGLGKVIPVNGLGYALFNNVKVSVNNVTVDSGSMLYPYRGDFETRLNHTLNVKEGSLELMGFDEEVVAFDELDDNNDNFDWENVSGGVVEPDAKGHAALCRRFKRSFASKNIYLITPIFSSLFEQEKYLPPHTKLYISLEQNKPAFSLMSKHVGANDDTYKIEILKCELYARIVDVDPSINKEIENVSYRGNSMLYPMKRVKMEQHRIPANMRDLSVSNLLLGETELPRRIFVAFVRHDACNGNIQKDPFNYQDFSLDSIGLRVGGQERPYPSFKCNFEEGNLVLAYWGLLETTGFYRSDRELGISLNSYPHRNAFFGFDLTSTQTPAGICFESAETQSLEIDAHIREAKTYPIEMIVYAEYDAEMEIQPSKKVIMHNNA